MISFLGVLRKAFFRLRQRASACDYGPVQIVEFIFKIVFSFMADRLKKFSLVRMMR